MTDRFDQWCRDNGEHVTDDDGVVVEVASKFISSTDTAKLLRQALKQEFAGVKFSVRTSKYAGGSSIDVSWTDGPTDQQVSAVAGLFAGSRFDGMIDMAYSVRHFLHDDGSVSLAHDPGTGGQRGSHVEHFGDPLDGSAREVHFCADYVFTSRTLSPELVEACARLAKPNGTFGDARAERCDGCGNWPAAEAACWYVEADRGFFCCSKECAGRLRARYVAGVKVAELLA